MRKFVLILLFLLLACARPAVAADYNINATWNKNIESDLAGYKLYYGDNLVATINAPASVWTGQVTIIDPESTCFTLSAFDKAGNESSRSAKYCVDLPPAIPTGLKINVQITINLSGGTN